MQLLTDVDITTGRSWPVPSGRGSGSPAVPNRLAGAAGVFLADLCAALLVLSALVPLLRLASGNRIGHLLGPDQLALGLCVVAAIPSVLALSGRYDGKLPFRAELGEVARAGVFAFLVAGCADTVLHATGPVRLSACAWLGFPAFSIPLRMAVKTVLDRRGLWRMPVLLVESPGSGASLTEILRAEARPGYRVASVLGLELSEAVADAGRWSETMDAHGAAGVVITTGIDSEREGRLIESLLRERIPFFMLSRLNPLPVVGWRAVPFFHHDTIMLSCRHGRQERGPRLVKRALDLAVGALLLALAFPVMGVVAILVTRDGGPAIFAHERIGANGRRFRCLKFRTMAVDAGNVLDAALARDATLAAEWASTQKLRHDPRVTPIGRFLRRTSVDELPQLLNVLRGEMSLVGPRPIIADEIPRYERDIAYYYETRPGLTGLWQVSGRSETTFQQRVRLDSSYVRNWTIWHDLTILAQTVTVVLGRRGAH